MFSYDLLINCSILIVYNKYFCYQNWLEPRRKGKNGIFNFSVIKLHSPLCTVLEIRIKKPEILLVKQIL